MPVTSDDIYSRLADPLWRMDNLYLIKNQEMGSEPVPMKLREEQRHYLENEHTRNFISKARQLGLSTVIVIKWLDECLFNSNTNVATIDYREVDCSKKLEMAAFAYHNGPKHPDPIIASIWKLIHDKVKLERENQSELKFSNGSKYMASMTFTGQSLKRLHISEFAIIADTDVNRAYKIIQGSLPAVGQSGIITIETTMRGSAGPAAELWKSALNNEGKIISPLSFKFFFYSWCNKKEYDIPVLDQLVLDSEDLKYFDYLKTTHNIELTDGQKNWYAEMRKTQRRFMRREFPTIPSECMTVNSAGQIYPEITELRTKHRITSIAVDKSYPIYCSADLGFSDKTALWAIQFSGRDILVHRCYIKNGHGAAETARQIIKWEQELGVPFNKILLPHDAMAHGRGSGKTYATELSEAGIPLLKIAVIPRTNDVWHGINEIRDNINRLYFDISCDTKNSNSIGEELPSGVECLELYKTNPNAEDKPYHDKIGISDACDAFRTFFEAVDRGIVTSKDTHEYSARLRNRPASQKSDFKFN